jgi:hypothetical protein
MRGFWLGLSSKHTGSDLLHADLLGVACAARQALDALVAISPSPLSGRCGSPVAARYLQPWRQLVAAVGATTTSVVRHRAPVRPYVR